MNNMMQLKVRRMIFYILLLIDIGDSYQCPVPAVAQLGDEICEFPGRFVLMCEIIYKISFVMFNKNKRDA